MSDDRGKRPYDLQRIGDKFVLFDGLKRLEAEGARRTNSEIRAVVRVFEGDLPIDAKALNFAHATATRKFIDRLQRDKQFEIADSALVALEHYINQHLPRDQKEPIEPDAAPRAADLLTREVLAVATDPRLIDLVIEGIHAAGGWVGDVQPPLLGYVAMTSSLLVEPRPMNLAYVSQSATGKNKAIDAARALMPPSRYLMVYAGSERSLIYLNEDLQHRMVIFFEADSIPDDGPAASAIRSLASDNVLAYDTVEQNPETNKFETRRISKPGPTGLVTTSTRSLQYQLGTRVLELPVRDDQDQTRLILLAQAAVCDGSSRAAFNAAPLVAFQEWLAASGPHRVQVPFASALPELVSTVSVRMRRDFPQLLSCICSVALLHVLQRERSPDGAIIATLDDYRIAAALLRPIFDSLTAEGVTPAIRHTVEAVPMGGPEISQTQLRDKLGIAMSTTKWRVDKALRGGWLKDLETRKGAPRRLVLGDPMPDSTAGLPSVERLQEVFESRRLVVTACAQRTSGQVFESSNGNRGEPLLNSDEHDGEIEVTEL